MIIQENEQLQAVTELVEQYRDSILQIAIENEYAFDVVFNAIAQVSSAFVFDYLLLQQGELNDENVAAALNKLALQTQKIASVVLENIRQAAVADAKLTAEVCEEAAKSHS